MSKYLEFKKVPFKGKTKRFEVISKSNGNILGRIQWYSQWRQYVFMPGYPTVWNNDCMDDVIFFIRNLMQARKPTVACNPDYIFLGESEKEKKNIKRKENNG